MRLFRNIVAVAGLPLFYALPALAQADNDKGGLPQLKTDLFPEQIFWLAISFGILYLLMSKVALPRVASTQDNRKQVIAAELEAARVASETAKQTVAQVEKSLAEARAKAYADVGDMIAKVKETNAERQRAQEKELGRRLHRAEADIAVAREAALTSIRGTAADLAAVVVEKILGAKGRVAS
jgi:F-type H+-transporting ATPase subunit b